MHKDKISKAKSVIDTRFSIKDHDSPLLNERDDGKSKLVNIKKQKDFMP